MAKPKVTVKSRLEIVEENDLLKYIAEPHGTIEQRMLLFGKLMARFYPIVTNHIPAEINEIKLTLAHQSKLLWAVLGFLLMFMGTILVEVLQR